MEKESIYQIPYLKFAQSAEQIGFSRHIAKMTYRLIHKKGTNLFHSDETLSSELRRWVDDNYSLELPVIDQCHQSSDGTVKFLFRLKDGNLIESVLIPFHKKYTVCLSTQVGCAMNCSFCFTATEGLVRNLSAHEIVGQYLACYQWQLDNVPGAIARPNLVFMGQGEPLHNFDEVRKTIEVLLQSESVHLGERQITLSTCGYLPGIKKLGELPQINIALSLHSPFNQVRSELIPANKAFPLEEVIEALRQIPLKKRQFLTFEYLLIDSINDREEDADELATLLGNLPAIINIIPFNPFPGSKYKRPSLEKIDQFKEMLVSHKLRVMIRTTKGDDILAACGQLKGNNENQSCHNQND